MHHSTQQLALWNGKMGKGRRNNKQFIKGLYSLPMILLVGSFIFFIILQIIILNQSTYLGILPKETSVEEISTEEIPMDMRKEQEVVVLPQEAEKKEENSPALLAKAMGIPVVVIDPGHGGEDTGSIREGVEEKEINLNISLEVERRLKELGYFVILTRKEDCGITLEERVAIANDNQADIYVSIHQNAFEDESVFGIETWYREEKGEDNKRLALLLQQQIIASTGGRERFVKGDSQMYGVVNTVMPACIIETGFLSNPEERSQLVTEDYQNRIAEGITKAIQYYFKPKTMYLTFDDGPYKNNTVKVLDILKKRKVKATFFLVGEYVEKNPEVAKRIVEEGHAVGVHCYRHDYDLLYKDVESCIEDFEKAHRIIKKVTGVDTKIYRFPGGSINSFNREVSQDIIREMTARGYIYYDWNAGLEDTVKNPIGEQLIQNAVSSTLGRKKVIMLAHDVVYETGECLEELLDHFPEYKMEVLTEEVKPIQF